MPNQPLCPDLINKLLLLAPWTRLQCFRGVSELLILGFFFIIFFILQGFITSTLLRWRELPIRGFIFRNKWGRSQAWGLDRVISPLILEFFFQSSAPSDSRSRFVAWLALKGSSSSARLFAFFSFILLLLIFLGFTCSSLLVNLFTFFLWSTLGLFLLTGHLFFHSYGLSTWTMWLDHSKKLLLLKKQIY